MTAAQRSIATLLLGSGVLFLGYGLLVTLLPVRAQLEGFSTTAIGIMGTAYFAGFTIGCLLGPRVVKRVGHIRCFAAFAALTAAAVLAHPLMLDPPSWWLLRFLVGLCLAVLYMVVESWLNEESSNEIRGRVLSLYIIVANVVTIGGQLMLNLYDPQGTALFSLVAMLIALSLVPLSLTTAAAPKPVTVTTVDLPALYRLSPAGFVGCLLVGLVEGAFWSLGPVFAQDRGMPVSEITLFMSAFMVGGTLSQWPLGRLSDRMDRRFVIAACGAGGLASGLALSLLSLDSLPLQLALAAVHGALMLPLYALCLAHANDYAPNELLVQTSSGLLLVYGLGAVAGPVVVAPVMQHYGSGFLFLVIAAILGLLAAYCLFRLMRRPLLAALYRVAFVPVPKTTFSVYALESDEPEGEAEASPEAASDRS
ncbi:MAG: MFS transporter [Kiloniellales bacterium]